MFNNSKPKMYKSFTFNEFVYSCARDRFLSFYTPQFDLKIHCVRNEPLLNNQLLFKFMHFPGFSLVNCFVSFPINFQRHYFLEEWVPNFEC